MSFLKYVKEAEEQDGGDIHDKIIDFFTKNPNPDDEKVHAFAEENGMSPHDLESHIYMVLSDILTGGISKGDAEGVDEEQLKMGIEVEKEHTSNPMIAKKIAADHLKEIPDYYTRLKKMEDEAKGNVEDSTEESVFDKMEKVVSEIMSEPEVEEVSGFELEPDENDEGYIAKFNGEDVARVDFINNASDTAEDMEFAQVNPHNFTVFISNVVNPIQAKALYKKIADLGFESISMED